MSTSVGLQPRCAPGTGQSSDTQRKGPKHENKWLQTPTLLLSFPEPRWVGAEGAAPLPLAHQREGGGGQRGVRGTGWPLGPEPCRRALTAQPAASG